MPFGGVKDVIITDKGFDVQNKIGILDFIPLFSRAAFVKFDTHENGAKALKALKALQWRNDPSYPHVNGVNIDEGLFCLVAHVQSHFTSPPCNGRRENWMSTRRNCGRPIQDPTKAARTRTTRTKKKATS